MRTPSADAEAARNASRGNRGFGFEAVVEESRAKSDYEPRPCRLGRASHDDDGGEKISSQSRSHAADFPRDSFVGALVKETRTAW